MYQAHKGNPKVWMVLPPFSCQKGEIKAMFFLISSHLQPWWYCVNSLCSQSEQGRRGYLNLVLTSPFAGSLKPLNKIYWVNRGNTFHNSSLPHPGQKQVPGSLPPALGTASPVFSQVSANPQEPGLPGLLLHSGELNRLKRSGQAGTGQSEPLQSFWQPTTPEF